MNLTWEPLSSCGSGWSSSMQIVPWDPQIDDLIVGFASSGEGFSGFSRSFSKPQATQLLLVEGLYNGATTCKFKWYQHNTIGHLVEYRGSTINVGWASAPWTTHNLEARQFQ